MWDAIASNQRRSWVLICTMGIVLILLGAVIGGAVGTYIGAPAHGHFVAFQPPADAPWTRAQTGVYFGIAAATLLWLILWATAVGAGDSILLGAAHAREIQKEDLPQLWNVVEEMTIAAGLPKMPRVFIIDDSSLNAFAVGRRPDKAAVAVTAGLLKRLSRDELQGVIAHELGHVRNLDVKFMTLASVMLGAIVLISQGFLRALYYGGGRRRSSREGGQAALILLVIAIVVAIVAPFAAQLLYFACSRRREYLADASSALFTRYPAGLASALEKISGQAAPEAGASKVVAPLCIVNPLQETAAFSLFSTHPPTEQRIRVLRGMAGAGLAAYEAAFQQTRGKSCLGPRTLQDSTDVPIRAAAPEPAGREQAVARARAVGELLDKVLPFVVIPCPCGVRLKLPPDSKRASITCPRCGREHEVPQAAGGSLAANAGPPGPSPAAAPLEYHRKGTGWESFQCPCGGTVQLSPSFGAPEAVCPKCGQVIRVL